jgi:6-pyruvoyltetrahydropterin/6-carboxytetrahydropterin synthase
LLRARNGALMAERMAQIACEFGFEASHVLAREDWSAEENERVFGVCARLHGHSYRLRVVLRGAIDPHTGMVINFADVKAAVRERVVARLDHEHLNDIVPGLTTAENLLYWIAGALLPEFGGALHQLELWETHSSAAILTAAELRALAAGGPPILVA